MKNRNGICGAGVFPVSLPCEMEHKTASKWIQGLKVPNSSQKKENQVPVHADSLV